MAVDPNASVGTGADTPDAPTRTGALGDPTPDPTAKDAPSAPLAEEKQGGQDGGSEPPEPSIPAGDPEAPVAPPDPAPEPDAPTEPSRPHGDELEEALSGTETSGESDHEGKLERDLEELAAKAGKAEQYLELAQRTKADFENYRKRAAREAAAAQERGVVKLAKALLPAVDNLDRALEAAQNSTNGSDDHDTLVSGIKLVHADVISALARVGIEPFDPVGERFDPQHHEAVAQQPAEGTEAGTIIEVYQRGYRLGESVLRPARVVVAG